MKVMWVPALAGASAVDALRGGELAGLELREHALDDERGGDRQPAVVQERPQLRFLHSGLEGEEGAQLRVAVLLDDEEPLVSREEALDVLAEGERAHPHVVDPDAAALQEIGRASCRERV